MFWTNIAWFLQYFRNLSNSFINISAILQDVNGIFSRYSFNITVLCRFTLLNLTNLKISPQRILYERNCKNFEKKGFNKNAMGNFENILKNNSELTLYVKKATFWFFENVDRKCISPQSETEFQHYCLTFGVCDAENDLKKKNYCYYGFSIKKYCISCIFHRKKN